MMTDETPSTDPKQQIPDLSGLADFQFGPAWARPGARQERPVSYPERRSGDRQGGDRRPRRDNREGRQPRGERRVDGQSGERRFNREDRTRGSFRNRRDQTPRSAMEEPTEGLRVELRPVDSGLAALHQEVQKHRRTISLLDLAKVCVDHGDILRKCQVQDDIFGIAGSLKGSGGILDHPVDVKIAAGEITLAVQGV